MTQEAYTTPPELFHYSAFYGALLWGCVHDRTHLVRAEEPGVARPACPPGTYRCDNGHTYQREPAGSWLVLARDRAVA